MTTLKVDFDGRIPARCMDRVGVVLRSHGLKMRHCQFRRTRHGYHLSIVVTGRVSFLRQVLIQSLLGSDWKRETYNSRRAVAWRNVPRFWRDRANVLYLRHYRELTI